jgi:hypothetical protein
VSLEAQTLVSTDTPRSFGSTTCDIFITRDHSDHKVFAVVFTADTSFVEVQNLLRSSSDSAGPYTHSYFPLLIASKLQAHNCSIAEYIQKYP